MYNVKKEEHHNLIDNIFFFSFGLCTVTFNTEMQISITFTVVALPSISLSDRTRNIQLTNKIIMPRVRESIFELWKVSTNETSTNKSKTHFKLLTN